MILIDIRHWSSHICDFFTHLFPSEPRKSTKHFELTAHCQIWLPAESCSGSHDSPQHNAAVRFNSLPQKCYREIWPLLHLAAERFDSPLHHAAGRFLQQSLVWLPTESCSGEIWSPLQNAAVRFNSQLYHAAVGSDSTLPKCRGKVKLQFNNSTNLKPNLTKP
jgi:hypothetical protein